MVSIILNRYRQAAFQRAWQLTVVSATGGCNHKSPSMGFQGQFGRHMNLIATLICTSPSCWGNWGFKCIHWPFVYLSLELLIHNVDKFSYLIVSPFLLFCKNFFHVIRIVLFLAALQFTLVQSLHIDFFLSFGNYFYIQSKFICFKMASVSLPGE